MLGATTPAFPIRLCGIVGYEGRINDVVYCHPIIRTENPSTVVFFGGDMQDFLENMQSHRDSKNYTKWNLESTASIINSRFPDCHTIIVRPARIEYKTFSCFKNFVPCNNCGAPDHTPMHYALQHLEKLLQNVSARIRAMTTWEIKNCANASKGSTEIPDVSESSHNVETTNEEIEATLNEETFWWRKDIELDKYNITLLGFSKGTVVLNQFLYEFHYLKTLTPDDHTSMDIVSRISDMYWLDGGHSGGKNTWITSRPLLETLTRLGIGIHIHVTPYQIQDDRRPWIRKEEKLFGDLLKRLGATVERTVHFENVCPTLFIHFDILNAFRTENTKTIAPIAQ